jgi:hypothetical protein
VRLSSIHVGDVVAIADPDEPRLGEVRAKQRGRLTVTPWPNRRTRDRAAVTIDAADTRAHYRRRARASIADVGDLVLVDIRGRRFHARVTERPVRGELRLEPLTPHINYFHARPRDVQTRWTSAKPAVGELDSPALGDGEERAE